MRLQKLKFLILLVLARPGLCRFCHARIRRQFWGPGCFHGNQYRPDNHQPATWEFSRNLDH